MSSRSSPYYAVRVSQTLKKSQSLHFFGAWPTPYGGPQRALGYLVRVRPKNGKKLRFSQPACNLWPNRFKSTTTLLSCVFPDTWVVIKVRQLLKKQKFWEFLKIFVQAPYGYHCNQENLSVSMGGVRLLKTIKCPKKVKNKFRGP